MADPLLISTQPNPGLRAEPLLTSTRTSSRRLRHRCVAATAPATAPHASLAVGLEAPASPAVALEAPAATPIQT